MTAGPVFARPDGWPSSTASLLLCSGAELQTMRAGIIRDWKPAGIRRGEEREHERAAAESPGEEARALTERGLSAGSKLRP